MSITLEDNAVETAIKVLKQFKRDYTIEEIQAHLVEANENKLVVTAHDNLSVDDIDVHITMTRAIRGLFEDVYSINLEQYKD